MYSNKFVISVLVNGQVQKEFANGEVNLPFGTEYAIRFRNKNDRRAVVKLFIDGEKMCRGGFVIPANSYRDIECSSQTLRKFKFVDLQSAEAQDHGKDQVNAEKLMGVIEARWHLEKQKPVVKEIHHHHPYPVPQPYPVPYPRPYPWYRDGYYHTCSTKGGAAVMPPGGLGALPPDQYGGAAGLEACAAMPPADATASLCSFNAESVGGAASFGARRAAQSRVVRDGATVEGDASNQRFGDIHFEYEEDATVLKLFLKGFDGPVQEVAAAPVVHEVEAPLVENPEIKPEYHPHPVAPGVDADARYCDQCGAKIAKKSSRFCHLCGHKLG